jgi:hypothetical protein
VATPLSAKPESCELLFRVAAIAASNSGVIVVLYVFLSPIVFWWGEIVEHPNFGNYFIKLRYFGLLQTPLVF